MVKKVQSFARAFISSVGLKRKLTSLFQVLSVIAGNTPELIIVAPLLQQVASWLGIVGVGHASIKGNVSKLKISTLAAFFSALVLAAQNVPELAPYTAAIAAIAAILGLFSNGPVEIPKQ